MGVNTVILSYLFSAYRSAQGHQAGILLMNSAVRWRSTFGTPYRFDTLQTINCVLLLFKQQSEVYLQYPEVL